MKQIFAFEDLDQAEPYSSLATAMVCQLTEYQHLLEQHYALNESPKAVIWTPATLATTVFSSVPIPAFTQREFIYMSPIVPEWKDLFFRQLDKRDLFREDFEDGNWDEEIWFEEGMCFYLPRKLPLTEDEFDEISAVEKNLVKEFKDTYGNHSLSAFGKSSYTGNLTSIMYDYWRSYLAVKELVAREDGDVLQVFKKYHECHDNGKKGSLLEFFDLDS